MTIAKSDFKLTRQTTFDSINSVINEKYTSGGKFAFAGCYETVD